MTLNAARQLRLSEPEHAPRRRGQIHATIMALAVTACSGVQVSDHAPRQLTLRVAEAALASGAPEMALRVADVILAKQPKDAPALIARGDALHALGREHQAEATYRAAVVIDPTAIGAQVGVGRSLARSDPRAAEAVFRTALAHEPDNVVALNDLGVALDMQGRNAEAQTAYFRALTVAPASIDVQINLGMSLALSGHSTESVQLLRGVAAHPDAVQAWRKELVAGLTLAGDGLWARQVLQPDSSPAGQGSTFRDEETQLASAAASSPAITDAAERARVEPAHAALAARNDQPRGAPLVDDRIHNIPESLAAIAPADIHNPAPDPAPRIGVVAANLASLALPIATLPAAIRPVVEITTGPQIRPPTERDSGLPLLVANAAKPTPPTPETKPQMAAARPIAPETAATLTSGLGGQDSYVQLASLLSEPDAMFEWRRLHERLVELLVDREPTITQAEVHGRIYWRLRTFGFASLTQASELCRRMRLAGLGCFSGSGL